MAHLDPAVKKETGYVALWVLALSLVMQAVYLVAGKWGPGVLAGNLGGALAAVGNFFLLGTTVSRAVDLGDPDEAARRVRGTASLRLLGQAAVCVVCIAVLKTGVLATLLPLFFPQVGIRLRPLIDRKRGADTGDTEGSDLLD